MDTQGIYSPDDGDEFDPPADLAAMALSIANRIAATMVPPGSIVSTGRSTAPSGWLICSGQAVSRTTYSDLFDAIGTTYGDGDGSTTFNVPNLKGRVVVGADAGQADFNPLGKTGGAKTHTLTEAQTPSKVISGTRSGIAATNLNPSAILVGANSGRFATRTQASDGGSHEDPTPHNNLQPYIALHHLIKI